MQPFYSFNSFLITHSNIIVFPLFLGKFGPLGETYDESEALGEPLDLDLRTAEE
jgi:hypothetical protein